MFFTAAFKYERDGCTASLRCVRFRKTTLQLQHCKSRRTTRQLDARKAHSDEEDLNHSCCETSTLKALSWN